MKRHPFILILTYISIACSCLSPKDKRLEQALSFAGDNRAELEKVLEHYACEPEKLEAARFLISNMPRWFGYQGWQLDSIKPMLIRIEKKESIPPKEIEKWRMVDFYALDKVYDAHIITADYLIENIDLAFDVWKRYPWNRNLSFDDFCELILPYRIGDEPLSNWRKLYHDYYTAILDSGYQGDDVIKACNRVDEDLKRVYYQWNTDFQIPHQSAEFLFHHRVGYCREVCDITLYAMRACGIPVACESFVYSPEYQQAHHWTVLRNTTGKFIQFGFNEFTASRDTCKTDGRKRGKVYRSCFGMQEEMFTGVTRDNSVPTLFRDRFVKDVTANYFGKNEVCVPVAANDEPYIYLGVFSPSKWIPVAIAKGGNTTAVFNDLEPRLIYQPLFSDGQIHRPAGYPFIFTGKDIQILKPQTEKEEQVVLKRKMSLNQTIAEFMNRGVIGAKIEGCSNSSFHNPTLLYAFTDTLHTNYYELALPDTNKLYRYIRFYAPPGKQLELGELSVFAHANDKEKIQMKRMNDLEPIEKLDNIVDNDLLTYFASRDTSCWITYDLGKTTTVGKIVFSPRNDDNYISPGDTYELFYQDGTNGWKSLGKQTAETQKLIYNVPQNALLWLRNRTKGKEEQVFIYKDGKQYFALNL